MSVAAVVRWFDRFIAELEEEGYHQAVIQALRRGRRLAIGEELEEELHPMYVAAVAELPLHPLMFSLAPWYLKKEHDRWGGPTYEDLERICEYVRTHPMPWLPDVVQLVPLDDPPGHDRWADDGGA